MLPQGSVGVNLNDIVNAEESIVIDLTVDSDDEDIFEDMSVTQEKLGPESAEVPTVPVNARDTLAKRPTVSVKPRGTTIQRLVTATGQEGHQDLGDGRAPFDQECDFIVISSSSSESSLLSIDILEPEDSDVQQQAPLADGESKVDLK